MKQFFYYLHLFQLWHWHKKQQQNQHLQKKQQQKSSIITKR
jgi:hypothetical protein